ncbi:aspartate/glutamate racemase family protein [Siminovitchia sp. 179-K 8D1 HS]|uniref:aspartate/glutamate racemase family protein n=1 Tax=Siminovitchia sp. 179-K 8D1 HS TaxID=3142385 RepID=UPI0039A2EDD7
MRIKIINPNTTESMTKNIQSAGEKYASSNTEIIAVSPSTGPASIESYFDEYLAVPGVMEEILKGDHTENVDAYVIACFGDPGLYAAREITDKPVVGIAEAAITISKFIAPNFSIVSVLDRSRKMSEEVVKMHGAEGRCKSIRSTGLSVLEFDRDLKKGLNALSNTSKKAVEEDGAESILLGCAGFVSFVEDLQKELGVPVLDGVSPAVKLAEILVNMRCQTSKHLTWGFPEKKEIKGFNSITKFFKEEIK